MTTEAAIQPPWSNLAKSWPFRVVEKQLCGPLATGSSYGSAQGHELAVALAQVVLLKATPTTPSPRGTGTREAFDKGPCRNRDRGRRRTGRIRPTHQPARS